MSAASSDGSPEIGRRTVGWDASSLEGARKSSVYVDGPVVPPYLLHFPQLLQSLVPPVGNLVDYAALVAIDEGDPAFMAYEREVSIIHMFLSLRDVMEVQRMFAYTRKLVLVAPRVLRACEHIYVVSHQLFAISPPPSLMI